MQVNARRVRPPKYRPRPEPGLALRTRSRRTETARMARKSRSGTRADKVRIYGTSSSSSLRLSGLRCRARDPGLVFVEVELAGRHRFAILADLGRLVALPTSPGQPLPPAQRGHLAAMELSPRSGSDPRALASHSARFPVGARVLMTFRRANGRSDGGIPPPLGPISRNRSEHAPRTSTNVHRISGIEPASFMRAVPGHCRYQRDTCTPPPGRSKRPR